MKDKFEEFKQSKYYFVVMAIVVLFLMSLVLIGVSSLFNSGDEDDVKSKKKDYGNGESSEIIKKVQSTNYNGSAGTWSTLTKRLDKFKSDYSGKYVLISTSFEASSNTRYYELFAGGDVNMSNYTQYISDLSFYVTLTSGAGTDPVKKLAIEFVKDNKTKPTEKEVSVYLDLLDNILWGLYPDADNLNSIKDDLNVPSVKEYMEIKSKKQFEKGFTLTTSVSKADLDYFRSNNLLVFEYNYGE